MCTFNRKVRPRVASQVKGGAGTTSNKSRIGIQFYIYSYIIIFRFLTIYIVYLNGKASRMGPVRVFPDWLMFHDFVFVHFQMYKFIG